MNNSEYLFKLAHEAPDELAAWLHAERGGVVDATERLRDATETTDSREKLEADVFAAIKRAVGNGSLIGFGIINGWLNRQADITRRTEQAEWIKQANGLIHEANVRANELRDELAKRDKGIARLKRQRDEARQELKKNRWEYCETCEHAEQVDRLEAERDALARDLADCERQRERLRQALGTAIDHAHEITRLVDMEVA